MYNVPKVGKNDPSPQNCCTTLTGCFILLMCFAVGPGILAVLAKVNPDERMTTPTDAVEQYYVGFGSTFAALCIHLAISMSINKFESSRKRLVAVLKTTNGLLSLATFASVLSAGIALDKEAPAGIGLTMTSTEYLEQRPYLASYLVALLYTLVPTVPTIIIPGFILRCGSCCCPQKSAPLTRDERSALLDDDNDIPRAEYNSLN